MIRLGLLRHGHTDWNRQGRIQGRTDIPLDAQARAELTTMRLPAAWPDAQIVSSPLQRAHETARLVSGKEPTIADALIEMNWGQWEGQRGVDLKANTHYCDIEHWGMDFTPPDGEAIHAVSKRVLSWAETLKTDTLVVTHIGVMRVLLARAHGWQFLGTPPFQIKRNRIYVIEISRDAWRPIPEPIRLEKGQPCA